MAKTSRALSKSKFDAFKAERSSPVSRAVHTEAEEPELQPREMPDFGPPSTTKSSALFPGSSTTKAKAKATRQAAVEAANATFASGEPYADKEARKAAKDVRNKAVEAAHDAFDAGRPYAKDEDRRRRDEVETEEQTVRRLRKTRRQARQAAKDAFDAGEPYANVDSEREAGLAMVDALIAARNAYPVTAEDDTDDKD